MHDGRPDALAVEAYALGTALLESGGASVIPTPLRSFVMSRGHTCPGLVASSSGTVRA